VAVLAVAVTWVLLFGTAVLPRERAPGPSSGPAAGTDLRVLTHNLGDGNPRLAETAQKLARVRADVVALQEIRPERLDSFAQPLDRSYPYRMVLETFAVWSRYPLTEVRPVETGPRSLHAVRMVLVTPKASVVLYVVHLISPDVTRRGFGGPRDETMAGLTDAVARDGAERIILVGDLNTAPEDRRARRLLALLDSAQDRVGHGFGFTWPARLPMTRIDHVLTRGVTAVDTSVLGRTGSDHRPVLAELRP